MELRKRGHSVSLWLLPCQFASGSERTVASRLGVDKLEGPSGSAWTWHALRQEKTDCVLQLGGDLLFGRRIAKYAKAPLLSYAYGFKKGMEYAKVFTAYPCMTENIDARLKTPKAQSIGDLVKDSLALDTGTSKWGERKESGEKEEDEPLRLLFFPGSRPGIRQLSLGWFLTVLRHLKARLAPVQIGALFSPFVPESEFAAWTNAGLNPLRGGAGVIMRSADYALTQPGTNTLEMMHCGLPALVAAPADFLEVIPVSGAGGLLSGVPLIGSLLKERAIRRNLKRYNGFLSWPNRIANRTLLDEAMGKIGPDDLAARIAESLRDKEKLSRVRRELLELSGPQGAALRLCDAVDESCE
jgi:lipid-A-disaccharide synthase